VKLCGPFEDGSFASVAHSDGRSFLAYQAENQVRVRDLATERIIRAYDAPGGAAFPLLKPGGSTLLVAFRRGDDARIRWANPLVDETPHDLGDVGANNEPFCWDGDWLWWQDAQFQIKRWNPVRGGTHETMHGQHGRGTGIARVVNGRAILRDVDRVAFGLTFPCYAGDYVALEHSSKGMVLLRQSDEHQVRVWPTLDCIVPKIVGWSGGVIAGTAGSGSVRAAIVAHADLSLPVVAPPPQPPPVTPPPAEPPPVVPPTKAHMLTAEHKALRARYMARFPLPSKQSHESDDQWEDRLRRQWTIPLIQQFMFSFPNDGFCVKSADAGRPESKDAMGRVIGGVLHYYDLLLGAGTGRPQLVIDPPAVPIPGQHIRTEYGPVDALGEPVVQPPPVVEPPQVNPPPVTPPPVTPPPASGDVLARLGVLEAKLDLILTKLSQPLTLQAKF
jgi:hypothetical protein